MPLIDIYSLIIRIKKNNNRNRNKYHYQKLYLEFEKYFIYIFNLFKKKNIQMPKK